MTDLILERSDNLLLEMRSCPEKYNAFVRALLRFVARAPSDVPNPPHQNITYVMDMLGEQDMSFFVCLLSPEVGETELCKLCGLSAKRVAVEAERIRNKIMQGGLDEFLLVPGKSVLAQVDECGVPVFVADLGLSPELQKILKRRKILNVSALEKLEPEKVIKFKGLTHELYTELGEVITRILQARENYRAQKSNI